jgi:hypothetical protein
MFPPFVRSNSTSEIAGLSNTTTPVQAQGSEAKSNNTKVLASAEMQLNWVIQSLQRGNTSAAINNLTTSQQQFEFVRNSTESGEEASIATAGLYFVEALKALGSGDTNSMNDNLNLYLQQIAPVRGISPWTLMGSFPREPQPAETGQDTEEQDTGEQQPRRYTDNELLAKAGSHLAHAIGALEQADTNTLNRNLITSRQILERLLTN